MTLIEILQGLMDGRFHSGDVVESNEGIRFEFVEDHQLWIHPVDQEPSLWDLTSIYDRQQQPEIHIRA
jgi:hypothetical protein